MTVLLLVSSFTRSVAQHVEVYYADDSVRNSGVFTQTEIVPYYKGSFIEFLMRNDHDNLIYEIVDSLKLNDKSFKRPKQITYRDTANVKFILRKDIKISDLTVESIKSDKIKKHLVKLIKQSESNWQIALQNGRPVNCWVNLFVYYNYESEGWLSRPRKERFHIDYDTKHVNMKK